MTPKITLIVSVDTEEDNWSPARTGITVENIRELPRLDRCFERLGLRATYFTTYQVAIQPWAAAILREVRARGAAEIGAHLHPWNTPPLDETFTPRNTMLVSLPRALQAAKLKSLTEALTTAGGKRPLAFRAGRWGFGSSTAAALLECGYRIDSSVTSFKSWQKFDDGPTHVGAPADIYRLDGQGDVRVPVAGGGLWEVPVPWGYSRGPWAFWEPVHRFLALPALRPLRLVGLAWQLGLLRQIVLNPEMHSVADMIVLSRRLIEQGVRHLHLSFHSPSLRAGLSPFVRTSRQVAELYAAVESYVEKLGRLVSVQFASVSEAVDRLGDQQP